MAQRITEDSFVRQNEEEIITENDLRHLLDLTNDAGKIRWENMMEISESNMSYKAWCHVPKDGPLMMRTITVFEDATPELVRDFFSDDEFRGKWDPMIRSARVLEEFPHTGTLISSLVKKFPVFCRDREYIIGQRIWDSGDSYYCVTKGVPYRRIGRNDTILVSLYFSSWIIRAVKSRKGDGQKSACEVKLVHYEDIGFPNEFVKFGARNGMWNHVKKLHGGLRDYQRQQVNARKPVLPTTRFAAPCVA